MHSWTVTHFNRLLGEFQDSVKREPLVPAGAPLDYPSESGLRAVHSGDAQPRPRT
jgi:hypothetical protein